MAVSLTSFETSDTILTEHAVKHIIYWHATAIPGVKKALFCDAFPLEEMLKTVSSFTWEPNSKRARFLEKGYRRGHLIYRIYVFLLEELVGWDPEGFATNQMAVYYSEKTIGDKWNIISCYPWTHSYDCYFRYKR